MAFPAASQLVGSATLAVIKVPPCWGLSDDAGVVGVGVGDMLVDGVVGVVGVVGVEGVVGDVGVAGWLPQEAITSEITIRQQISTQIIFLVKIYLLTIRRLKTYVRCRSGDK